MIEREEIITLAKLSNINLSDEQIDSLTTDMQSIVSFADMISKAQLSDEQVIDIDNIRPMRCDIVKQSYKREEILKNTASYDNGYFKVSRSDM